MMPTFARSFAALASASSLAALLAGCAPAGGPDVDDAEIDTAAQALCPAPGTTPSFGSPNVLLQEPSGSDYYTQPAFGVRGDFNGDGEPDAVFIDGAENALGVFVGTGSGLTFSHQDTLIHPNDAPYYSPQGGAALDFDGDGDLDVAFITQGGQLPGSTLVVALNNGAGVFSLGPTLMIPSTYGMKRVAAGDFDGDGRPDLAITSNVGSKVQIVLNTSSGLGLGASIAVSASPWDIAAADLDLDGKVDLVVGVTWGSSPVRVYRGNGDGTFAQVTSPVPRSQSGNGASTTALLLADLDGDGRKDLAYVESVNRRVHFFRNTSASSVSFANEIDSGAGPYTLSEPLADMWMVAEDFNADGRPDLMVLGNQLTVGGRLHVLGNTAAPGAPLSFAATGGPWSVSPGGKTSVSPRGVVVAPFDGASCGSRPEIVFSSANTTAADWSVQYVRNTTN